MDHWGDPWADNANDKSPTKNAVTSPLPPAFTFAPVPLNGFVDDAGWGNNEDDGFGDWATPPRAGTENVALNGAETTPAEDQASDSAHWGTSSHQKSDNLDEDWPEHAPNLAREFEYVDSEPSDSATVSQLDEVVETDTVKELKSPAQLDVESARSSTSPSEASRQDLPIESPRTSIEDERSTTKDKVPRDQDLPPILEPEAVAVDAIVESPEGEDEGELQATENADKHIADTDHVAGSSPFSSDDTSGSEDGGRKSVSDIATTADEGQNRARSAAFAWDEAALAQLFPASRDLGKEVDLHDDPIYSTSARKAWYRLTRKQTMREYNHGDNDDNYIRVTWTNSNVRAEVNKVVGRWAREDRISGTGPGARASFYWDTPAPIQAKIPSSHLRTQSSVPATKTALPARQSLPPLATDDPAAFNWSSQSSADSWKLESPAQRLSSPALTLRNPAVAKLQRHEGRAASLDLTPRRSEQVTHKRTASVSPMAPETPAVAKSISPPMSQPSAKVLDPWASVSNIDTLSTAPSEDAGSTGDDDDDWGEMVQTPTLPTFNQPDPFPNNSNTTTDDIRSSTLTDPVTRKANPAHAETNEPMFASPIVRLQSTISPTSALFKANSFVPLHVEQGPIGPGLLKPANRDTVVTPEGKVGHKEPCFSSKEQVGVTPVVTTGDDHVTEDAQTASEGSSAPPGLEDHRPATPADTVSAPVTQSATTVQTLADSWTDADFSIFESAPPSTVLQPALQTQDSSDPLSIFDTPARKSTSSPLKDLSASAHDFTPPPLQPLNSATNSVQRRKAEEDEIISTILCGLPDLNYMLL